MEKATVENKSRGATYGRLVISIFGWRTGKAGGVERLTKSYAICLEAAGLLDRVITRRFLGSCNKDPAAIGESSYAIYFADLLRSLLRRRNTRFVLVMPDSRVRLLAYALAIIDPAEYIFIVDATRFTTTPSGFRKSLTFFLERKIVLRQRTIATYTSVFQEISRLGGVCLGVLWNPVYDIKRKNLLEKRLDLVEDSRLFNIVFLGRLEIVKGADLLPNLCAELKRVLPREFVLNVYGEGSLKDSIEQSAKMMSVDDVIVLNGPTERPSEALLEADVVVLPSRSEGPSLTAAEAMVAGVVLIHTKVEGDGPFEISGGEIGGIQVDQGDVAMMASVITRVAAGEFSHLEPSRIGERYSPEAFVAGLSTMLENMQKI